jgi:hypothetical protein
MIQGLKKDHTLLSELLFTNISVIQETLLFLYSDDAYIHDKIIGLNMSSLGLLTLHTDREIVGSLMKLIAQLDGLIHEIPMDTDRHVIYDTLYTLVNTYIDFLGKCQKVTNFNSSPYSTEDVIIIGFEKYDQSYDAILEQLYELKYTVQDWNEVVIKAGMDDVGALDELEMVGVC